MSTDALAYVALISRDASRAAHFFEQTLGLARSDVPVANTSRTVPVFAVGRSAVALFAPGDPFLGGEERAGVHHLAFSAPDPEQRGARAQSAGVPVLPGGAGLGLQNRKSVALDPTVTAGVKAYWMEPIDLRPSPPGKVERLDHIGIASADNGAGIEIFCGSSAALESQQTDMELIFGRELHVRHARRRLSHAPPRPVAGLRVAFISVGDTELEFLQNFDPGQGGYVEHGSAGTTRQDQGAIAKYVAARGPGCTTRLQDARHQWRAGRGRPRRFVPSTRWAGPVRGAA